LCDKGDVKTLTVEYPDQLDEQLRKLVEAGWFKTPEDGVVEALRRYLSGHSVELQEKQIMEDVEWGLHGRD
jgi:Arc/MetJ-type ribon-helix-helix transcriptional regulator